MKLPGPDHPITIAPSKSRVRVRFAGKVVADTARALVLAEAGYKPVFYIPREDADMSAFKRTEHHTHCPYKGDANYFSLEVNGQRSENAVWTYEKPYPAMNQIGGRLAFYRDRVEIEEVAG